MPGSGSKIVVNNIQRLWKEDRRKRPRDAVQGLQNVVNNIISGETPAPPPTGSVVGYAEIIGDGTTNVYTVTHDLDTRNVLVQVWDEDAWMSEKVDPTITVLDDNRIQVQFSSPADANQYRVVVVGFQRPIGSAIPDPTPPGPAPETTSYPYVLYSEQHLGDWEAEHAYLRFASKRTGDWTTVTLDDSASTDWGHGFVTVGVANNANAFCAVSWGWDGVSHEVRTYRSLDEGQTWTHVADLGGMDWEYYRFVTYACGQFIIGCDDVFLTSTDMATWTPLSYPNPAYAPTSAEWCAVDEQGNLHALFRNSSDEWFYVSTSDLSTWTTPVQVFGASGDNRGVGLACHGQHVWAVYWDRPGPDIIVQASHDRGVTWDAPVTLNVQTLTGTGGGITYWGIEPYRVISIVIRDGNLYVSVPFQHTNPEDPNQWDWRMLAVRCNDAYTDLTSWTMLEHRPIESHFMQSFVSAGGAGHGYVLFTDWSELDTVYASLDGPFQRKLALYSPVTGDRDEFFEAHPTAASYNFPDAYPDSVRTWATDEHASGIRIFALYRPVPLGCYREYA